MYLTVYPLHARVMIAQLENEWISLPVLSMARVMIAQWENECISLSVLSAARIQLPGLTEYFKEYVSGYHIPPTRPEPGGRKWLYPTRNETTQPVDNVQPWGESG